MSDEHEDRRKSDRRKRPRRMYDALHGKITEEERRHCDNLLWSRISGEDRRMQDRRSENDRRIVLWLLT